MTGRLGEGCLDRAGENRPGPIPPNEPPTNSRKARPPFPAIRPLTCYFIVAGARLASGPDVWEVIRAVRSARIAEPDLAEDDLLALVADNTGTPLRLIRIATRYWASYPDEIDAEITTASTAEDAAEHAWQRERQLLAG